MIQIVNPERAVLLQALRREAELHLNPLHGKGIIPENDSDLRRFNADSYRQFESWASRLESGGTLDTTQWAMVSLMLRVQCERLINLGPITPEQSVEHLTMKKVEKEILRTLGNSTQSIGRK
jgi:hypothetical protein